MRRESNRETLDLVLVLGAAGLAIWGLPGLTLGDAGLTTLYATQFLLLTGAAIVIMIERQICQPAASSAVPRPLRTKPMAPLPAAGALLPAE